MTRCTRLMALALVALSLTAAACGGPGGHPDGGGGGGPGTLTVATVALSPAAPSVGLGGTKALTATATMSDGSTQDVTASATWASGKPAVATVSAAGVVTAVTLGTADVTATASGITGTTTVTVTDATVASIAVAPGAPTLGLGATQLFVATGTMTDGSTRNVSASVTWNSSAPAVASISAAGVVTASTLGTAQVTATQNGVSGSTTVTVSDKKLTALEVTPAYVSITSVGSTQLTATGTWSDGSKSDVSATATWVSTYPANATVSSTGLVSGVAPLSALAVTASVGALSSKSVVSVTSTTFPLVGITLSPQSMWVGQTLPFPFVAADMSGIGQNYSYVSWTHSNPAVATLDTVKGTMTALAVGTTTLTARTGTLSTSNTLTITAPPLSSLSVLPVAPRLAQGSTLQLSALGVYPDTNLNKDLTSTVSWSSGNPAVATVNSAGLVTAVSAGSAVITASSGGVSGTTSLTVPSTAPPQTTVALSPVDDNSLLYSSLVPARQTTVYPTTAMFNTPGIAVGCSWLYSPPIGFAPERIDPVCGSGLIKFDLSSLAGKTIVSATLRLETSVYGVGFVPRRWFIRALASSWNGSTVTWDNSANFLHYVYSETQHDPPTYSGQVYSLDQTQTVQSWVAGGYQNDGWELGLVNVIFPQVSSSSLDMFEFYASEATGHGPQLIVTWQ